MRFDRIAVTAAAFLVAIAVGCSSPARSASTSAADAHTLTFVLAGQSNMAGHGADPDTTGDPRVQVLELDGQTWGGSAEPFPNGSGSGPGLSFGQQVADDHPSDTVRLIQCAVSESAVRQWAEGGDWYNACLAMIGTTHVDGVLFFQGESEAASTDLAATWPAGYLSFVDGMRGRFPNVPIVYAQIGVYTSPGWDLVKQLQSGVQGDRPNMTMIQTDDLPTDGEHFPAASYRVIGHRFATAWAALTQGDPAPVAPPQPQPAPPTPAPAATAPTTSAPAPPAAPALALATPATPVVAAPTVEEASWAAFSAALSSGLPFADAALAARSAGMNAVYQLGA